MFFAGACASRGWCHWTRFFWTQFHGRGRLRNLKETQVCYFSFSYLSLVDHHDLFIIIIRPCFKFHRCLLTFTLFGFSVCTQSQFLAPRRTLRPLYVKPAAGTSWMMAMLFSGYLFLSGIPAPAFILLASFSYINIIPKFHGHGGSSLQNLVVNRFYT